jgi:hypothetical protein
MYTEGLNKIIEDEVDLTKGNLKQEAIVETPVETPVESTIKID